MTKIKKTYPRLTPRDQAKLKELTALHGVSGTAQKMGVTPGMITKLKANPEKPVQQRTIDALRAAHRATDDLPVRPRTTGVLQEINRKLDAIMASLGLS